ncbi:Peptidyl-prolyl cis-trans isomerase ppiD [Tenacibaculum sp. 190524A02b]|uniref:hypothetical protein n=1 Tax=Tenacibaculum vairaonense TaxID=3137860 RepID=UPI0032B1A8D3
MRKIFLIIVTSIIISCNTDISSVFKSKKENFIELSKLVKENDKYFFNDDEVTPRLFLKSLFSKDYHLLKADMKKSLDKDSYVKLNELLNILNINEFYLSKKGDLFYKVLSKDYFIRTNEFFIGHILQNDNNIKFIDSYSVDRLEKIDNEWFAIYCNRTLAN